MCLYHLQSVQKRTVGLNAPYVNSVLWYKRGLKGNYRRVLMGDFLKVTAFQG